MVCTHCDASHADDSATQAVAFATTCSEEERTSALRKKDTSQDLFTLHVFCHVFARDCVYLSVWIYWGGGVGLKRGKAWTLVAKRMLAMSKTVHSLFA